MNLTVFAGFTSKQPGSSKPRNETESSKGSLQSLPGSYFIRLCRWPEDAKQPESSSKQLALLRRPK